MNELRPEARAFLDAARPAHLADRGDRARLRAALAARLLAPPPAEGAPTGGEAPPGPSAPPPAPAAPPAPWPMPAPPPALVASSGGLLAAKKALVGVALLVSGGASTLLYERPWQAPTTVASPSASAVALDASRAPTSTVREPAPAIAEAAPTPVDEPPLAPSAPPAAPLPSASASAQGGARPGAALPAADSTSSRPPPAQLAAPPSSPLAAPPRPALVGVLTPPQPLPVGTLPPPQPLPAGTLPPPQPLPAGTLPLPQPRPVGTPTPPQAAAESPPSWPARAPSAARPALAAGAVAPPGSASPAVAEELRLVHAAQAHLRAGRAEQALASLSEHARLYPQGVLREERVAARVLALCALGRSEQARREADAFARGAPRSPYAGGLRRPCGDAPGR